MRAIHNKIIPSLSMIHLIGPWMRAISNKINASLSMKHLAHECVPSVTKLSPASLRYTWLHHTAIWWRPCQSDEGLLTDSKRHLIIITTEKNEQVTFWSFVVFTCWPSICHAPVCAVCQMSLWWMKNWTYSTNIWDTVTNMVPVQSSAKCEMNTDMHATLKGLVGHFCVQLTFNTTYNSSHSQHKNGSVKWEKNRNECYIWRGR